MFLQSTEGDIYDVSNDLINKSKIWKIGSSDRWLDKDQPINSLLTNVQLNMMLDVIEDSNLLGKLSLKQLVELRELADKLQIESVIQSIDDIIPSKLPSNVYNKLTDKPLDKYGQLVYDFVDKIIMYLAHSVNSRNYYPDLYLQKNTRLQELYSYPSFSDPNEFRLHLIRRVSTFIDKFLNMKWGEVLEMYDDPDIIDRYDNFIKKYVMSNNLGIDESDTFFIVKMISEIFPNLFQVYETSREDHYDNLSSIWLPGGMPILKIVGDLLYIIRYKYRINNNKPLPIYDDNPFNVNNPNEYVALPGNI